MISTWKVTNTKSLISHRWSTLGPWIPFIIMILLTDRPWSLHAEPVIQHTQAGCRWKSTAFLIPLRTESIGQGSGCSRWCVGKR
jgi:hypothetical protein